MTGTGGGAVALTPSGIPVPQRDFFVEEFRGCTIVIALPVLSPEALQVVARTVREIRSGDTRFVLVVPPDDVEQTAAAVDGHALEVGAAGGEVLESAARGGEVRDSQVRDSAGRDGGALGSVDAAELWLAVADSGCVVVGAQAVARTAGTLSAGVRATKTVLTDPGGGWGTPRRSFADIDAHRERLAAHLAERGLDDVVAAAQEALAGGAYSVNLCRAEDLEFELLTFDGRGTVLTQGRYLHLSALQVDDFPAIEALVAQGVREGVLKPRSRIEIARMAAGGLGARVLRTGHLAGIAGLEVDRYEGSGFAEVSGLITVAEFSGLGAGGILIDGLLEKCRGRGLSTLFAVTVSAEAAQFFQRRGFVEAAHDDVPAAKWDGYDADRRALARCFRRPV